MFHWVWWKKKKNKGWFFRDIVVQISTSPDSQMSERLRQKCVELLNGLPSEAACYDLLDSISKEPCLKVADKVCLGEISSFIQALCDVTKHYPRPKDACDTVRTNG